MILAYVKERRKKNITIAYKYTKLDSFLFYFFASRRHIFQFFFKTGSGQDKIKQNQPILPLVN